MTTGVKAAAIAAALGGVRRGRDRRRGGRARGSDCGHPLGRRGRTRRTLGWQGGRELALSRRWAGPARRTAVLERYAEILDHGALLRRGATRRPPVASGNYALRRAS